MGVRQPYQSKIILQIISMLSDKFEKIASQKVQDFIFEEADNDIPALRLRHAEMFGLPFATIAEQLSVRKRAAGKISSYHKTKGIVYPPSVNLEQSSSEATARFKAKFITREFSDKLGAADLTGGFGVDCLYLSKVALTVDYVEPDLSLLNIVRHNQNLLGAKNINYYPMNAEKFIDSCKTHYDLIYLDPSRRDDHKKKVFELAACKPNVLLLLPKLFRLTDFVLIKTSPLLDITEGLKELGHTKKVVVLSVGNECKELLFLLQEDITGEPLIETYNLDDSGQAVHTFSFAPSEEKDSVVDFANPQTYVYEPNASILKSGAFKLIGEKFGLQKVHPNTHFYSSVDLKEKFPGRVFKIEQHDFNPVKFPEMKANVITRNYPLKAEELRKKLKLIDGGEKYVIAFSGMKKKYIVLASRLA